MEISSNIVYFNNYLAPVSSSDVEANTNQANNRQAFTPFSGSGTVIGGK